MDSPDKLHFGAAKLSHFRNENTSAHVASRSIASELKSGAREVCDLPTNSLNKTFLFMKLRRCPLFMG